MTKIPNITDIIASHFNQDTTLEDSAADLGAIILEMSREKQYYGEHTRRMTELKKIAAVQEEVILRMLERSVAESDQPKRPHLTVVK